MNSVIMSGDKITIRMAGKSLAEPEVIAVIPEYHPDSCFPMICVNTLIHNEEMQMGRHLSMAFRTNCCQERSNKAIA